MKQLLEEREQLSQQLENAREKVHSLQASLNLVGANVTNVQVRLHHVALVPLLYLCCEELLCKQNLM